MQEKVVRRVGARTQPCFTPLIIGNGSEWSLLCKLTRRYSHYKYTAHHTNRGWQAFIRNFITPWLMAASNIEVKD